MTPDKLTGWLPIERHGGDSNLYDLAYYYEPSAYAEMNGSVPFWCYAVGRKIYDNTFTGILGGKPSHFKQMSGDIK